MGVLKTCCFLYTPALLFKKKVKTDIIPILQMKENGGPAAKSRILKTLYYWLSTI